MSLDPLTAYLVVTLLTVVNGVVLGFIKPVLPLDLRPSASDWRIATFLMAASTLLFVAHAATKQDWLLPVANACIMAYGALTLRALRRFAKLDSPQWLYVPAIISVLLHAYYTLVEPNLFVRLTTGLVATTLYVAASVHCLLRCRRTDGSISSIVLAVLMALCVLFLLVRWLYFAVAGGDIEAITQSGQLVNVLTPMLIISIPIVGTTAFALLCFERARLDLQVAATTDSLTGLPNRRTIIERANVMFEQAQLKLSKFAIGVIDIDHFKLVNDRFGHDVGDRVLAHVARVLSRSVREGSVVGRQGGEEFVVLFDAADNGEANAAADRLRAAVEREPFVEGEQRIEITVSIGLAMRQLGDTGFQTILRRADRALYAAKDAGRNCVRIE